jgi:hypothetical protein
MIILFCLALISAGSWVLVFSKSARDRLPWLWLPRARLQPSGPTDVGRVITALGVAIVTTVLVIVALINEPWTK